MYDSRRGSVRTWLVSIAHNLAIDAVRVRRPIPVDPGDLLELVEDISAGPERASVAHEDAAELRAAIATLPPTQARFALGGFVLGTATTPAPVASVAQPALLSAPLTTDGRVVGHIYAATATPSWVYMGIDTDHGTGTVSCQLQQRNGHLTTLGTFDVKEGYGTWGAPSPIDPTSVVAARVVAADGTVLATAAFRT